MGPTLPFPLEERNVSKGFAHMWSVRAPGSLSKHGWRSREAKRRQETRSAVERRRKKRRNEERREEKRREEKRREDDEERSRGEKKRPRTSHAHGMEEKPTAP